jgi:hypothetical protein
MLLRGLAPGALPADQEQRLVAGVSDRVDRLGQHRRRLRQRPGRELGDRDARVGQQRGDDRLGSSRGRHQPRVRASSTSITGMSPRTG